MRQGQEESQEGGKNAKAAEPATSGGEIMRMPIGLRAILLAPSAVLIEWPSVASAGGARRSRGGSCPPVVAPGEPEPGSAADEVQQVRGERRERLRSRSTVPPASAYDRQLLVRTFSTEVDQRSAVRSCRRHGQSTGGRYRKAIYPGGHDHVAIGPGTITMSANAVGRHWSQGSPEACDCERDDGSDSCRRECRARWKMLLTALAGVGVGDVEVSGAGRWTVCG